MKISPNAYGIIRTLKDGSQIAHAISKDGQTIEFKMKFKTKSLQAQDIIDLCDKK